jgi:hypothetical protein
MNCHLLTLLIAFRIDSLLHCRQYSWMLCIRHGHQAQFKQIQCLCPPPMINNHPQSLRTKTLGRGRVCWHSVWSQHSSLKVFHWRVSDGGGIRGYASLCVLKILMDAIGKHERGHKDPHESSFARSAPQAPALNGSAGHSQMGGSQHHEPPPRAPTDSSVVSSRSWPNLFRRQATTRSQQTNGISRQNTELETESSEVQRFLPCHYFDYIGGTSTGG